MRLSAAFLVALLAAKPLCAQAPYLVRDVNQMPSQWEADPRSLTAGSSTLYFVGGGDSNGREIRRLDAGLQLTLPVDLQPGEGSPNDAPVGMATAGDVLYFEFKQGLYRTDGTPAGTTLVRQFGPAFSELTQMTGVGTGLFFIEYTNGGRTLWWSDGTPAGTIPLVAVESSATLTASGGRVFWVAYSDVTGAEPWTSDGTVAGTHVLKDICPGPCFGVGLLDQATDVAGTLYFRGNDGVHGPELWKSDGTAAGTVMVADVVPGFAGQGPGLLTAFGSLVLYVTYDQTSGTPSLWRSDGSPAGTQFLRSGVQIEKIVDAGGLAFFDGTEPATGREVWRTDGTAAGTAVVDMCAGPCSSFSFTPKLGSAAGVLVFTRGNAELWRSDGTTGGTFLLRTFDTLPQSFTRFAGSALFAANDGQTGRELWRSDGSVAGTQVVQDVVSTSSWVLGLTSVGDRFFFDAVRPDLGPELWSTTGTAASTTFVDLRPGPEGDYPYAWARLADRLLVTTAGAGSGHLWSSDGSAGGTTQLAAVAASWMAVTNGIAFFDGSSLEPWRSDGTVGGTFKLGELHPGTSGSLPFRFVAYRDRMFFSARAATTHSLWQSDGTTAGTTEVTPQECYAMAAVADILYLQCGTTFATTQLWATDGTALGTRLVKDIRPVSSINNMFESAELDGILYFAATDPQGDYELWRSDGTGAGTYQVKDIVPGPAGSSPFMFKAVGGALYFLAWMPATGYELWRSDGTDAGTFMVRDINPGPGSGVFELEAAGGQLLLSAYTQATGVEPWRSDGTNAGTVPLPEIAPGPSSSVPFDLHAVGRRIYFAADDGVTGGEPWAVDMPAGAVAVGDAHLLEGDSGTQDVTFDVRLESPSAGVVQVGYATVPGSAQAGLDFQPRSGVLTFPPGAMLATVAVPVIGDLQDEPDETFRLELSPVGNTVLADRNAFAVIFDDDAPRVTIANTTVTEGDAGPTSASFNVTLTTRDGAPTPNLKTVGFASAPLTATAGLDFVSTSGTLTFPAGTPSGTTIGSQVTVNGDLIDEPDETFELRLGATSDAIVPPLPAIGLIQDDDGIDSDRPTELGHGTRVRATLKPPAGRITDRDLYVLRQQPWASYEIVVDETSGDAVPLEVRRLAADGTSVLQSATAVGTGGSVSLRWENADSVAVSDQHVRIESAACGTTCGDDDTYRLRFYETTLSGPRFNNAGDQVTVMLLQNPTNATVQGRLILWAPEGLYSSPTPFTVPAHGLLVLNTASVLSGVSGSITVTHDGPYGALVGKAVALEPSTGFSFDTPLTYRPR